LSHITISFRFVLPAAVFGPNDAAFAALGSAFTDLAANETALFGVLAGHVVQGEYTAANVIAAGCVELDTLAGTKLKVMYMEAEDNPDIMTGREGGKGKVTVNDAEVVDADLMGVEGVFHGIDMVILPGSFTPCPADMLPPTAAPGDSAASVVSSSVAMVAAVAAFFAF
jgi:uncharacterized surface protein with fasciclin (FAS1) repeats